jgi:Flp pilus assembly protein TadG
MVTAFVVVFAAALVFVSALVVDGGRLLAEHRHVDNLSDSAARAGAQAISDEAVRAGRPVILDPDGARDAACAFLATAGQPCTGGTTASVDANRVTVTVRSSVDLLLLPGGSKPVRAQGTACVAIGIDAAAPC